MKYKTILFLVCVITIVSCEKEGFIKKEIETQKIGVEESYLVFSTQDDFDSYLSKISENLDDDSSLKSSEVINQPKNFHSLADKINETSVSNFRPPDLAQESMSHYS